MYFFSSFYYSSHAWKIGSDPHYKVTQRLEKSYKFLRLFRGINPRRLALAIVLCLWDPGICAEVNVHGTGRNNDLTGKLELIFRNHCRTARSAKGAINATSGITGSVFEKLDFILSRSDCKILIVFGAQLAYRFLGKRKKMKRRKRIAHFCYTSSKLFPDYPWPCDSCCRSKGHCW